MEYKQLIYTKRLLLPVLFKSFLDLTIVKIIIVIVLPCIQYHAVIPSCNSEHLIVGKMKHCIHAGCFPS